MSNKLGRRSFLGRTTGSLLATSILPGDRRAAGNGLEGPNNAVMLKAISFVKKRS